MTLDGKRVLITGGAGFIGSHIADLLTRENGAEIVVLDNFTRGRQANLTTAQAARPVRIIEGDIRNRELVDSVMRGIDVVFHQAAIRITQCAEDPRLAMEVLVDGTFNVIEAAKNHRVHKVIVASSASVYGMAEDFPTNERHHPYNNRTLYGAAKAFNESLLRSFAETDGLRYIALRYFNVYGPRMDVHGVYTEVLVRWMERIAAGKPPLILGDGLQTMDFIHVRDVARANILAVKADVSDEVINIASGTETSLRELGRALVAAMGEDLDFEFGPARKVNAVSRRLANTKKAETLLGFRAAIDLDQGLRELVTWWRQERESICA